MFYITGDTHGDFRRIKRYIAAKGLTDKDTMIVLGDAGINYFGNSRDLQTRKFIAKLPITLFCIHGNHEMRPETLPMYYETEFCGGTVYIEDAFPNILFAKDGEIYDFDGIKTVVAGGAYSVDKDIRIERGWSWFEDEQPSEEIKARVENTLDNLNWQVDVMLTHTCPCSVEPTEVFLPQVDQSTVDKSTENWLQTIEERLDFKKWYVGHYHTSKLDGKFQFMFEDFDVFYGQPGYGKEKTETV